MLTIIAVIFQYIHISSHYVVHLKLMQCYVSWKTMLVHILFQRKGKRGPGPNVRKWKTRRQQCSMLGMHEYLLLQAHQQNLEPKMQLLHTVTQEFQKVNQGGKLAHTSSILKEN